jgi:hypothetical protein
MVFRDEAFVSDLVHEDPAFGLDECPYKLAGGNQLFVLPSLPHVTHSVRSSEPSWKQSDPSLNTLDFPVSKLVRNKFLFFINDPV